MSTASLSAGDVTRSMNELLRLVQQFGIHCDNNIDRIQSEAALNAKGLQGITYYITASHYAATGLTRVVVAAEKNNSISARVATLRAKDADQHAGND